MGFIKKQNPAEDEENDTGPGQGTGTQQQNGRGFIYHEVKDFSLTTSIHISFAGLASPGN